MSRSILILSVLLLSTAIGEVATAQTADLYNVPGGNMGGNAGVELSKLRRRDIGTGYSGENLIRRSLSAASIRTPYVGGYTGGTIVGGLNRSTGDIGLGGGPVGKPFDGASNGPTVSPYLNLFREDFDGSSDFNYQTLVRPQLQQLQLNQDLQQRQQETNQRVQALSARQDYSPQGSESIMPTGHTATFRYHSHFYPTIGRNRRVK